GAVDVLAAGGPGLRLELPRPAAHPHVRVRQQQARVGYPSADASPGTAVPGLLLSCPHVDPRVEPAAAGRGTGGEPPEPPRPRTRGEPCRPRPLADRPQGARPARQAAPAVRLQL